ncbi:MAG: AsmA-like C-terminal region-containing protein, partial [Natronospirillum sp.]
WQFDILPENDQIRLEQIQGQWRGIQLLGDLIWRMPDGGEHSTQLDLSAETGNVADPLIASGLTPLINSRSAAGRALLSWRGSPTAFDVTGLNGGIDFDLRNVLKSP